MRKKAFFVAALILSSISFSSLAATNGYVTPSEAVQKGSSIIYNYNENNQFVVRTKVGYLTDLVLGEQERIQSVVAGDTEHWMVSTGDVKGVPHIYIKPIHDDQETNVIVNTERRSYRFLVKTSTVYDDIVAFYNIPMPTTTTIEATPILNIPEKKLNKEYQFTKAKNVRESMVPIAVFDDGIKTFIEIAPDTIRNLPVVYSLDSATNTLSLVNSRLQDQYLVIDTVLSELQLRFGNEKYLNLVNLKEAKIKKVKLKDINRKLNTFNASSAIRNMNKKLKVLEKKPIVLSPIEQEKVLPPPIEPFIIPIDAVMFSTESKETPSSSENIAIDKLVGGE